MRLSLPLAIIMLFTTTCDFYDLEYLNAPDNLEDYTYQADFAIPLINSALNIQDIVEPDTIDLVEVDDDNLVRLVYSTEDIYTRTAGEVYGFNDQSTNFTTIIAPQTSNKENQTFTKVFTFETAENERIDSISFLQAVFRMDIEAQQALADGFDIQVNYSIPGSRDDQGNQIENTFLASQGYSEIDVSPYMLTFENADGVTFFSITYNLTLLGTGTPTQTEYSIRFDQSLRDIEFNEFYGNIGTFNFTLGSDNVKLGVFDNTVSGNLFFNNPMVNVAVTNFFGVEIAMNVDAGFLINNESESLDLEIAEPYSPWIIDQPQSLGDSAVSLVTLNKQNTNIFDIIPQRPTRISYLATCTTNPDQDPEANNAISYDSRLQYSLDFDLPLDVRVQDVELENTVELDLEQMDIGQEIDSVLIQLIIENEFPINGLAQIYFLNQEGDTLTDLFETPQLQSVFEAAPAEGEFATTNIQIKLTQDKADKVFESTEVVIKSVFDTFQSDQTDSYVKIYDHYQVRIKAGALVSVNSTQEFQSDLE